MYRVYNIGCMASIRKCFIAVLLLRVLGKSFGLTRSRFFLLTLNGGSGDSRYIQPGLGFGV